MSVHGSVIFRHFLKEVDKSRNIRKYFDSCLDHSCYFAEVVFLFQHLFHIRKRFFIKRIGVHFLNIFPVHPAQLCNIKHCRRFTDMMIVKCLHQFLKRIDFSVFLGAPSEKSHKIHNSFRQKSLIYQVLIRRMSGTLAQLLMFLICYQRAVSV